MMPPRRKKSRPTTQDAHADSEDGTTVATACNDEDRPIGRSLADCMRRMLVEQIGCDVHFLCGESGERVGAHKFVLVCRSSVFASMLESSDVNEIKVPDIPAGIMKSFLRYLYCEDVVLTVNTLMGMIQASKTYQVHNLIYDCSTFLSETLTVNNACTFLELTHASSEPILHQAVLDFVKVHAADVLKLGSIKDLCKECLKKVLEYSDLGGRGKKTFTATGREKPKRSRVATNGRKANSASNSGSGDHGDEPTEEETDDWTTGVGGNGKAVYRTGSFDKKNIALLNAYNWVKRTGGKTRQAARIYKVAESTLRTRLNNPKLFSSPLGHPPLFTSAEEKLLANHCRTLAGRGQTYCRAQVLNMAANMSKLKGSLHEPGVDWYYAFIKRYPVVKVRRKSEIFEAKNTNASSIENYFEELSNDVEN